MTFNLCPGYLVSAMTATVSPTEIPVTHTVSGDREFIKFSITGWDDVKPLTKKVLVFDGRKFVFSCWNSDDLYCVFVRMLDGSDKTARFARK